MALNIAEVNTDKFLIKVEDDIVFFEGEIIEMHSEKYIKPFLNKVREQMDKEIIIDISKLDFINSTGLGCFVDFILDLKSGCRVNFRTDLNNPFQQKAWNIFKSLGEDNVILG